MAEVAATKSNENPGTRLAGQQSILWWLWIIFCSNGFSPLVAWGNRRTEERGSSSSHEEPGFFRSPVLRGAWTPEPARPENHR